MDPYAEYMATGDLKYLDAYLDTIKPPGEVSGLIAADMRVKLAGTTPVASQGVSWAGSFVVAAVLVSVFLGIVAGLCTPVSHAAHPRPVTFPALRCPTTISLAVNPPLTSYNHWILGDHRRPATLPEITEMWAAIQNALASCRE